MKRSHNDLTIKEILSTYVKTNSVEKGYKNQSIKVFWKEEMGDLINGYTSNVRLVGTTLYLTLTSSPLRQELMNGSDKLISIINTKFGAGYVEKIIFY